MYLVEFYSVGTEFGGFYWVLLHNRNSFGLFDWILLGFMRFTRV